MTHFLSSESHTTFPRCLGSHMTLLPFEFLNTTLSILGVLKEDNDENCFNYMPQIPRAAAILLFGFAVSSFKILANVSECLLSEKSNSANAFS